MSENHSKPTRRNVLKKTGAATAVFAGVAAPSSAQVGTQSHSKDHWIEFSTSSTSDEEYTATLPDDNPEGENLESNDTQTDCGGDCTEVNGFVNCSFNPCHDVWHFDGDTSEVTWDVDINVDVETSW